MDYQELIDRIYRESLPYTSQGTVAAYIPALANIDKDQLALSLCTEDCIVFSAGNADVPFSLQSISKVFSFTLAYQAIGEEIWHRMGKEASGNAFNSLVQLEYENGIPRNPFINAGALVVADILLSKLKNPWEDFIHFVAQISGDPTINFNKDVAASEREVGHRNAALAHFMHSFGNIHNPVEEVLEFYFRQCALEMTTPTLARSFLFLANHGILADNGKPIITLSKAKRINALMLMAGLYNESGDFAYRVGLPAKSGVGGGIAAVHPKHFSIAVWSPAINHFGNSVAGIEALERFTTYTQLSIF